MSKRVFVLIIALMSISLIGIIAVQVYWIKGAIESKQKQFENDVQIALARTSEKIKERELDDTRREYSTFIENDQFRTTAEVKNYLFSQIDTVGNKKFVFGTFLEENYKFPTNFSVSDSVLVKKITGKKDFLAVKYIGSGKEFSKQYTEKRYSSFKRYTDWEKLQLDEIFSQRKKLYPIHKRISNRELKNTLKDELQKRNIRQDFKYGVYEDGLATTLKSGYFKVNLKEDFYYPLMADENGNSNFKLYINFPEERKTLLSDVYGILFLRYCL